MPALTARQAHVHRGSGAAATNEISASVSRFDTTCEGEDEARILWIAAVLTDESRNPTVFSALRKPDMWCGLRVNP